MPNYIYMGHGADIIKNGHYDKLLVPPHCNYLTVAKTGLTSHIISVMNLIKINLTPEGKTYLDNPELYYDKLSMLVAGYDKPIVDPILSLNDLHLTTTGEVFNNNSCDFIFSFDSGPIKYLYKSGLYNMSKVMKPYLPIYKHNATHPKFNHDFQHKFVIDTRVGIDLHTIKSIYKDSVFPTSKKIVNELKKVMGLPSRPSSAPTRSLSTNSIRKTKSASPKSKKIFSYNPNVDTIMIPYDLFVTTVKKIVDEETGFSLMNKFPGNHYNFVCRSLITDYPINQMLLHRSQSNNRANRKRNGSEYEERKLANPILNFRLFLEEFMSDQTRMKIGRTRKYINYETILINIMFMFDEYLKRGVRKSMLIITIDNFIDELNTYIEAGFFTINEVPLEIISKLNKIIDGEPPIIDGEPFIFHKLM